ncbi:MAG: hypothetical protein HY704_11625 [Gemmatimonadetes bacterium]|nr:hypothetical protein [Gemmatimonadota bacterium]
MDAGPKVEVPGNQGAGSANGASPIGSPVEAGAGGAREPEDPAAVDQAGSRNAEPNRDPGRPNGGTAPAGPASEAGATVQDAAGALSRRRPTPVRELLGQAAPPGEPPAEQREEARHFAAEGTEWIARVAGRCLYGTGSTPRAAVMVVDFFRADAPEMPANRLLVSGSSLEAFFDEELSAMLTRSEAIDEKARRASDNRKRANRKRRRAGWDERGR